MSERKEKRLEPYTSPVISELINSIPDKEAAEFIVNDFLSEKGEEHDPEKITDEGFAKAYSHFRKVSPISTSIMANPSTANLTEALYARSYTNDVDRYFCKSPGGRAIGDRLEALIEKLTPMIVSEIEESGPIRIANFGSGPGRDTIHIVHKIPSWLRKGVNVSLFDNDERALREGMGQAKHLGVYDYFEFNLTDLKEIFRKRAYRGKFDLGLLIGIICPKDKSFSKKAVKFSGKTLKKGGTLVTSAAHKRMGEQDPFTDYLMRRFGGWRMNYKDEEDISEIYMDSGLDEPWFFYDQPLKFHNIAVGKK